MLVSEVCIALHHREGLVAQDRSDLRQARSRHGEIGGAAMPQIVEPEILEPCGCYGRLPRAPWKVRFPSATGEQEVAAKRPIWRKLSDHLEANAGKGERPAFTILRVVKDRGPPLQIDICPAEAHELRLAGSGADRQDDE